MIVRLRSLWLNVNASYWFYPALFTMLALVLAIVTIAIDRSGQAAHLVKFVDAARPEGARNVLNVIAGSMIGVASTVFSITIAAVVYASGNYGPRLLINFMEDRGNQLSLATFIGTFVYAVMVLRVVREAAESSVDVGFVPQLSLVIATGLMLISIGVLVFFLNHVPASIRINSVLEEIGRRLTKEVRQRFPKEGDDVEMMALSDGQIVPATGSGYIQIVDFSGLADVAREHKCRVVMRLRPGDFVHPEIGLMSVHGCHVDDEMAEQLRDCFSLAGFRSPAQDIEFLIDELVEIGLRALSPGINDPFTAVTAMHWLGASMSELARRDLRSRPGEEEEDWQRVIPLNDDFDHFLRRGFGSLRSAAATSPIAAAQFLDCLLGISAGLASQPRREALRLEGERLMAQARIALAGPSLAELEERSCAFEAAMKKRAHHALHT
ncbi:MULTISPECIES: DUF2254 domain-containing protein [unclassified Sphingobium]|uniref:DUF2254 domain-containing protein n=1 Tax=unclassified Sphingobium TaxID=2611147 RepID=UPI002225AB81|nr:MULTISPECIES: DUF2254 domain-containing protein [unclassified Sphingobium]MCW2395108.1 putative membrane protein [Sphingobium sp. B8D3B]MCW2418622.1 putative membrane protein [Sphingobium sp. B8D3C]